MKTLALAMLIPVAICTACSRSDDSLTTTAPVLDTTPVETAANNSPAVGAPAVTGTATATAPGPGHVSLTSAAGSSVSGNLTVTHEGAAVTIRGEITGLTPGNEHGFHVHEVGECSLPDFASAGEHFNPTKDPHGGPDSRVRHQGDMPNVKADDNGRANVDVTLEGVTLVDSDGAPTEIMGKSLVVHAMPDDYKTQPSGGSGARIACGVIR